MATSAIYWFKFSAAGKFYRVIYSKCYLRQLSSLLSLHKNHCRSIGELEDAFRFINPGQIVPLTNNFLDAASNFAFVVF